MEKEIEPFADDEYEPQEINGRMTLWLHGEEGKRKKVEADKIPKIYEAMRAGWDISIQYTVIDGVMEINEAGLERDEAGKYIIAGNANFMGASFARDADFSLASFTRDANFWGARFDRDAHFWGARFTGDTNFREASFDRDAYFRRASFECPADFAGVVVRENTVWRGLWNYLFRPLLWPVVWLFSVGKRKLSKATMTDIYSMNTNTVMDTSSNPRLKRYIDDEQWINSWRSNPKWRRLRSFGFWWWEVTSHCGRSIGLWAFWSVFLAVLFAFVYQAFGSGSITFSVNIGQEPNFKRYLYYSVVTFTTLGFGDIIPKTDWARLAVGAEVVLGYVMLGGLISIFANKFARRS